MAGVGVTDDTVGRGSLIELGLDALDVLDGDRLVLVAEQAQATASAATLASSISDPELSGNRDVTMPPP